MSPHPLHSLGFEAVASLADLGFEPQLPVGMQEPRSGRKIVQPTENPAINQALATEAMAAYKARLAEVIRQIPGATLVASRDAKNPHRLKEKIHKRVSRQRLSAIMERPRLRSIPRRPKMRSSPR